MRVERFPNARTNSEVWGSVHGTLYTKDTAELVLIHEPGIPNILKPENNVYLGCCRLERLVGFADSAEGTMSIDVAVSHHTGGILEWVEGDVRISVESGLRHGTQVDIEGAEFRNFVGELLDDKREES